MSYHFFDMCCQAVTALVLEDAMPYSINLHPQRPKELGVLAQLLHEGSPIEHPLGGYVQGEGATLEEACCNLFDSIQGFIQS